MAALKVLYILHFITCKLWYNVNTAFNGRTILNHNGGGYGFNATQDILPEMGLGAALLTNSVEHNTARITIRNLWNDIFELEDKQPNDCNYLDTSTIKYIGLYKAEDFYEVMIPRNGQLYLDNNTLNQHNELTYFTENNDIIEFISNDVISVNYDEYIRVE